MNDQIKDLMELFTRADALLHRYQGAYFRNFGPFSSPHKGQGRVLSLLKLQPEITQKELGYLLDMRNQSLGELLGKLERNGYITRTPSEKDRRVMNIRLTDDGSKAAEELGGKQDDVNQIFFCLSDEEQAMLSDYLERLINALEKTFEEMGIPEHDHGHHGNRPLDHPHGHPHNHPYDQQQGHPHDHPYCQQQRHPHDHPHDYPYGQQQQGHPHDHPRGQERNFGRPQDFGKPIADKHIHRTNFEGRPDYSGYPKHPGHLEEASEGFTEDTERPEFYEGMDCPKHPGCHGNRCRKCDFDNKKDSHTGISEAKQEQENKL